MDTVLMPNALVTPDYRPNQAGSSPPQVQSGALRSGSEALSLWLLAYFPTEIFKLNPCAAVYEDSYKLTGSAG